MKNHKIICGNSIEQVAKNVIATISASDLSYENVIVVPDRYSLIVENMVFDVLNIDATFNISVVGINRYAKKIIADLGIKNVYVSTEQSILLVRRAISLVENGFISFKKQLASGFCEEIFSTISQLKSNKISAEKLFEVATKSDVGIKEKLLDTAKIYEKYEQLLCGKLDAGEILNVFEDLISKSDKIANAKYYFVGFDSLTIQGYAILQQLICYSKGVCIGAVVSKNQRNSFLFDNEMLLRCKKMFEQNKMEYDVCDITENYTCLQNYVCNNLFLSKPENYTNNDLVVFNTSSKQEEIKNCVSQIKWLIKSGVNFSSINIGCNLENYKDDLQLELDKNDISYFMDCGVNFNQIEYVSVIKKFIDFLCDTDIQKFVTLFKSRFVCNDYNLCEKVENILINQPVDIFENHCFDSLSDEENKQLSEIIEKIKKYIICKNRQENISYYVDMINNICEDFNFIDILEKQIENAHNTDIKQEKILLQLQQQLQSVFDTLNYVDDQITLEEFDELFSFLIERKTITSVPAETNCVYIADATKGFFESKPYLFVLGANQSDLPVTINDCGVITDAEISKLEKDMPIGPTVNMINKRNKLKIYELLLKAQEKLFISYVCVDEEGKVNVPANFVTSLEKGYDNFKETISSYNLVFGADSEEKENFAKLKNQLTNMQEAKLIMKKLENVHAPQKLIDTLYSAIKVCDKHYQENNSEKSYKIEDAKKLFFPKNKTKISQLERYFDCPYKHFVDYGLKAKERQNSVLEGVDVGVFLHSVAEMFCKQQSNNLGKLTDEQTKQAVIKITTELLQQKPFDSIQNNKQNKYLLKLIKTESFEFAKALNNQQKQTKFIPKYFEQKFSEGGKFAALKIGDLMLTGVIDRIDEYQNYFRIIDYKSGKIDKDIASVYYGKKIQLYVYQNAVEKSLNKTCGGVFYYNVKNNFESKNNKPFMLEGFAIDDVNVCLAMDTGLSEENPNGTLIKVKLKIDKNGEVSLYKNGTISLKNSHALADYAVKVSEKAIEEITSGNISVCPTKDSCEYCKYNAFCGFNELCGNQKRKLFGREITADFVSEVLNDN